jgi:hypothetical protein
MPDRLDANTIRRTLADPVDLVVALRWAFTVGEVDTLRDGGGR